MNTYVSFDLSIKNIQCSTIFWSSTFIEPWQANFCVQFIMLTPANVLLKLKVPI
jgi:hypothetical protein